MSKWRVSTGLLTLLLGMIPAFGQQQQQVTQAAAPQPLPAAIRPDYQLGPNDQILVRSSAEELNDRPFRVDNDGFITFPLVNRVQVSGLTVQALEEQLRMLLQQFFVQPQVGITITGFRSEPVSFFGAFLRPSVYALQGGRTLLEMLSVAGGFQPNASRRLRITRRAENGPIPLPSAIVDPVNGTSTVEINLDNLLREINPAEDIILQAYDRVTVDQAQPVYVSGEVVRPTAVELGGKESISVMQALAMVGGFNINATRDKVSVLRPVEGTSRLAQIDIDVARIVAGEDNDFPLFPTDILYIPTRPAWKAIPQQMAQGLITSLPYILISAILN